jgi:hypothetical protein
MADNAPDDPRPQAPAFTQKPPVQSDYTTTTTDRKGNNKSTFNAPAFRAAQDAFLADQKTYQATLAYYREHELPEWTERQKVKGAGQVTANTESARRQSEQAIYQAGPEAHTMAGYKAGAMPLGTVMGSLEGEVFGRGLSGPQTSYGLPAGKTAFQGTAAKRGMMMVPPGLIAAVGLAKAWDLYRDANDPSATPYDRDWAKASMNYWLGQSAGAGAIGTIHALKDIGGPNSLSGGSAPAGGIPSPAAPVSSVPPPSEPLLDLKGKTPTEASEEILRKLGIEPGKNLTQNRSMIQGAYPNASPAIKAALAASHPELESLGSTIGRLSAPYKRFAIPLGLLGGTAALLSPSESEAGEGPARDESITGYKLRKLGLGSPAEAANTASYLAPVTGPARMAWDIGTTGGGIARHLMEPGSVLPPTDEPPPRRRLDTDIPPLPPGTGALSFAARERDAKVKQLEASRAEDARQRAELTPKRVPIGTEAAQAHPANGGVYDYRDVGVGGEGRPSAYVPAAEMGFNPEHLPEYERGLLEKGIHPSVAAMHLMPHVRAGAEAVRRGEDFEGGTDQYERERAALRNFYGAVGAPAQQPMSNDGGGDTLRAGGGRIGARQ